MRSEHENSKVVNEDDAQRNSTGLWSFPERSTVAKCDRRGGAVDQEMCLDNSELLSSIQISISLEKSTSTAASKDVVLVLGMVGFRWHLSIP